MIIAGLGNPGREYENTRHNVGFLAVEKLCLKFKANFDKNQFHAKISNFSFKGESHVLVKPLTFMNLSGESISRVLENRNLSPVNLLVIVDDVNLPLGRLRLRPSGSDGGHNGLKSIIGFIGKDFWRLRIGIGKATPVDSSESGNLVNHVLGPFGTEELEILGLILEDVPDIVAMIIKGIGNKAMGRFNGKNYVLPDGLEKW